MKQSYEWLLAASLSVILSIVSNLQQIRRACSVNRCIGVCGGQQIIARSLCVDSNPIRHLTQGFRSLLQQDVSRRVVCVCRLLSGRKVIIKLISSFSLNMMILLIVTRYVGNKCDLEVGKKGPSIRCADKEMSVVWHLCNCLFFSDQTKDDVNGTSPTTAHGDTQPIAMVDQFNRRFGGIAAKQPDSSTRRKMRRSEGRPLNNAV